MRLNFPKILREKFSIKLFSIFACFIFIISFAFTAFFYRHQSKSLTDTLKQNNLLLAGILAYNSRIGVFSENEELLENPIEGIFQQKETEAVSIYNTNGELLKERRRTGSENANRTAGEMKAKILDIFKTSTSPYYFENKDTMEFWSPVIASSGYSNAESLFLDDKSLPAQKRTIGFVRIIVGKSVLSKKLDVLLIKSVLIGLVFLFAGCAVIYFTVIRIVNPLNKLIKGVQTLGKGEFGKKVPVETEDEIGKLALAFNQMSESLQRREAEKEQLEAQLRHSQRMEAIGTLAGGIAHDFNNILGIIMGYAELALLTTPEKDEMDSHLKAIFQASIRARDLIKQILAFSRQEKQEQFPMLLQPVVEEGLKMMRASLPATIEIRHDFKPGLSPVLSNPTQIHQVLMNLCTNAGHAMQENGGVLEVKLNQVEIDSGDPALLVDMLSGCYQVLTVSDTGHGMAASVKERIFDPFFTTKGPGKGTGMGLSVVHGIIKSQGGKVICHSEPGKGTIFEVFFPASEEEVSEKSEPVDSIPLGSERILFVDDEAAIVDIGTRMLQSLGYSVVGKTNSIHALETFRSQPDQFDLLITDNFMPAMTGLELSKNIKRIRPHLPVILCTGFSEGLSDEKVKAHGIEGFVMKPIIREKMAKIIRNVIGG